MNFLDKSGMGNTLWHFGDSFGLWGTAPKGFSSYIADYYNLELKHMCVAGNSNDLILYDLIEHLNYIKEGDRIMFNWSFFPRTSFVNKEHKVQSFNQIYTQPNKSYEEHGIETNEYMQFLINESDGFNKQYTIKLFRNIINPIIKNLHNKGIPTTSCFISNITKGVNGRWIEMIDIPTELETANHIMWGNQQSYLAVLQEFDLLEEGEHHHYKVDCQKELSELWLENMTNHLKK